MDELQRGGCVARTTDSPINDEKVTHPLQLRYCEFVSFDAHLFLLVAHEHGRSKQ